MRLLICCLLLLNHLSLIDSAAAADKGKVVYKVNQAISDGKNGRVWRQWRETVANRRIERVEAVLRRTSGANDTFVNLRFGNGEAFENGKQIQISNNDSQTVAWQVGSRPEGQPLVLNAYNGEIQLERVIVYFPKPLAAFKPNTTSEEAKPKGSKPGWEAALDSVSGDTSVAGRCRRAKRVQAPKIEIGKVEAHGGLFSGKYRISGSLFGSCIEEAGYFENAKLKQKIEFPLEDTVKRVEFQVNTKTGKNGEIRLFSTTGQESIEFVDEIVAREKSVYR